MTLQLFFTHINPLAYQNYNEKIHREKNNMNRLDPDVIHKKFQAFRDNPIVEMNRHPEKIVKQNDLTFGTAFSADEITNKSYIAARETLRDTLLESTDPETGDKAAFQRNDNAADLVDDFAYNNLQAMADEQLTSAKIAENPWSDDYWAIYQGILGNRYSDPNNPSSPHWLENKEYIDSNPAATILQSSDTAQINMLSPSEKYDALIGDNAGLLTNAMWAEGEYYYKTFSEVETWMGICHGWAPAAYMLARPTNAVTLTTSEGIPITFYPSDIKALATLLWANISTPSRFIGGRCNDKEAATDPENGRNISDDCFDTNPATWHMAIVNQIGVSKRSLVVDATYDYEVWNQPALAYEYRYVNLNTDQATHQLSDALLDIKEYNNDPFAKYRSNLATHIVGIAMSFDYMVETSPTSATSDTPDNDAIFNVRYLYDLELDSTGKIIGGEWRSNLHPDFLWTPAPDAKAVTLFEDQATDSWTQADSPLPINWQVAAQQAATQQRAPLAKIVDQLLVFSNTEIANNKPKDDNTTIDDLIEKIEHQ